MVYSEKLAKFKNLIHGFTTREEGDFRDLRSWGQMTQSQAAVNPCGKCNLGDNKIDLLRIDRRRFILPEQVHADKIALVGKKNRGKVIKGVDGLITHEGEVVLGVTTADCLPILFYEPKEKIVAIVHAGWKGSLKGITLRMVKKIRELGGDPVEVIAAIGPHIKKCCYDIDKKRGLMFKKEFGRKVIIRRDDKSFLDLTKVNLSQLLESGIKEKNIETSLFCTHCNDSLFFSYRREKEDYGEMLSMIGMTNFLLR